MTQEFDEIYAAEQLRRSRSRLRRMIKHFYLNSILSDVIGPTIDLGCGAGQLLRQLPAGSVGLEVNPALVSVLQKEGLDVRAYDPEADQLTLAGVDVGRYQTLVISHVLEHLADPAEALRQIFRTCARLGVARIVIVVPCEKGFASDATHKTYVDIAYLRESGAMEGECYTAKKFAYFPLNMKAIGKYFVFHELKVVFERTTSE